MKIVYTDMVADLFHAGHIQFLEKIKNKFPDHLIYVGLMADEQAEGYKRKPVLTIDERFIGVNSCKLVSKVIKNAPMPVTEDFITKHNIAAVIHADDISNKSREYWYKIPINLGIYYEIEYSSGISTTDIIKRIKNSY
jgi:ethanolamine-phosphate cytidylyltransferase/choline-phosphate cytidylyltransferase